MTSYLVRRLLLMILTLVGMSIIIFVLLRLVPGNIADILFDSAGFIDPQEKAYLEEELGLDQGREALPQGVLLVPEDRP